MKKVNIAYWIVTIIFAAWMLFSSYGFVINGPDAVKLMHDQLGYPVYITPFIGWMKILGVIAILIPGFPRLKEWAYAGLIIDLVGATYSFIALGGEFMGGVVFMAVTIAIGFVSYFLYHKRAQLKASKAV
ncbi:MAG: DoxX family protein [Bacteroidetes bacterium]|nr:DoxX family protein [Bacteroidota bacterium]